jgi:hypothetical protein
MLVRVYAFDDKKMKMAEVGVVRTPRAGEEGVLVCDPPDRQALRTIVFEEPPMRLERGQERRFLEALHFRYQHGSYFAVGPVEDDTPTGQNPDPEHQDLVPFAPRLGPEKERRLDEAWAHALGPAYKVGGDKAAGAGEDPDLSPLDLAALALAERRREDMASAKSADLPAGGDPAAPTSDQRPDKHIEPGAGSPSEESRLDAVRYVIGRLHGDGWVAELGGDLAWSCPEAPGVARYLNDYFGRDRNSPALGAPGYALLHMAAAELGARAEVVTPPHAGESEPGVVY